MPISLASGSTVEVNPPVLPVISASPPSPPTVTVAYNPVTGSTVTVEPPALPVAHAGAPVATAVTVLPVVGPPGPQGPPGVNGVSTNASCVWPVATPVYLVQVIHDLGFYTAGVIAIDTQGYEVEYAAVSYPSINITEISFDVPFSGTLYLS